MDADFKKHKMIRKEMRIALSITAKKNEAFHLKFL